MSLIEEAKMIKETIISDRRYLHENAEVGIDLPKTKAYVKKRLLEMGYQVQEVSQSGLVVTVGGKKPGKTFLLRADMDGLPMEEKTGLPYACKDGNMHSCGHDTHAAMLLGAAKLLKEKEDEIEGTIKLMFQPDEEGTTGARAMIEGGVLENPKVDAAMMLHIFGDAPLPTVKPGTIAVMIPKGRMASCERFRITINGVGGHGAAPETTVDPIIIGSNLVSALQVINSREVAGTDVCILTIGKFRAGDAPNIIPNKAVIEGTIRTLDKAVREKVNTRFREIAEGIGATFRAKVDVEILASIPPLIQNEKLSNELEGYVRNLVKEDSVFCYPQDFLGSEDFAEVCDRVPGVFICILAVHEDANFVKPQHNPKLEYNEEALHVGAAVYANCAIEWLKNNK